MALKELILALLTPGWEAAELVLPVLHVCIFSLLCFLYYLSETMKDIPSIQIHFKCLGILTLCLWITIFWFTNMYRQALKESIDNEKVMDLKISAEQDQLSKKENDKINASRNQEETKEETTAKSKELINQEPQTVEYCD